MGGLREGLRQSPALVGPQFGVQGPSFGRMAEGPEERPRARALGPGRSPAPPPFRLGARLL